MAGARWRRRPGLTLRSMDSNMPRMNAGKPDEGHWRGSGGTSPAAIRSGSLRTTCAWIVAGLALSVPAIAQDAGVHPSDGGADVARIVEDPRTDRIRALLYGSLDVQVEPRALFDVDIDDEEAVLVERARITAMLDLAPDAGTGRPADRRAPVRVPASSASASAPAPNAAVWLARLELDRARLAFYELPRERRAKLFEAHEARRVAARPVESETDRQAREAEEERQRLLHAAREARAEAERLVNEEMARLVGVEKAVILYRERLTSQQDDLAARGELVLGWQRRARDAKDAGPQEADATYDALRKTLRASRTELSEALEVLEAGQSQVPALGADPLDDVPSTVATDAARKRRLEAGAMIQQAAAEEQALRKRRASALLEEINTLNRERLALLPHLSSARRSDLTGFTAAGLDQARAEARHLSLMFRLHGKQTLEWLRDVRGNALSGSWFGMAALKAVPWILLLLLTVWTMRRAPKMLEGLAARAAEADRESPRSSPGLWSKTLGVLRATHRTVEWLLVLAVAVWIMTPSTRTLFEVQIVVAIAGWSLGAATLVNAINALADHANTRQSKSGTQSVSALRLRSLRLVGRVAVGLGLLLVLTSRAVGEGTIHSWVASSCWIASIIVLLVLVGWWRETIFNRLDRLRRKTALQRWLLEHRTGWVSLLAAMLGAANLVAARVARVGRTWLGGIEYARRAHAWLFKRGLERLSDGSTRDKYKPVRQAVSDVLAPDRLDSEWLACPADEARSTLQGLLQAGRGGVVAIIGGRGFGKTSLLQQLGSVARDAAFVSAPGIDDPEDLRKLLEARHSCVLLDDAQGLTRPGIGGLALFDRVLLLARENSDKTLWVFAVDAVVWPFLRRARDSRPLFDRIFRLAPWSEGQIADLIRIRDKLAGIDPSFEDLLERLPPGADEIDRLEALDAKRSGYVRMIWDYASGCPAIALEVWRSSLMEAEDGSIRVRPMDVPSSKVMEGLPDAALFILRAVMQTPEATVGDIARITRLTEDQVSNAVRFGEANGYLLQRDGVVQVPWRWLRPVLVLLERRHLLVSE